VPTTNGSLLNGFTQRKTGFLPALFWVVPFLVVNANVSFTYQVLHLHASSSSKFSLLINTIKQTYIKCDIYEFTNENVICAF
jgi:hypothetical protein